MTPDGYWALLRTLGVQRIRPPSPEGTVLCKTREDLIVQVIDPDHLDEREREDMIAFYRARWDLGRNC